VEISNWPSEKPKRKDAVAAEDAGAAAVIEKVLGEVYK
jgi:hypothetical protein